MYAFRYDEDPPWADEKGNMWSLWLLNKYVGLNKIRERTKEQDAEIDMIYAAARRGRAALAEVERTLRSASGEN